MNTEITTAQQGFFYLGTNSSPYIAYELGYEYNAGTRRIKFNRRKENVSNNYGYSNLTMGTTTWHHLVLTYDNTNMRLYVNNGAPTLVATTGNGAAGSEQDEMRLGRVRNVDNWYASCTIDDVCLFNKTLSATEVALLYNDAVSVNNLMNQYRGRSRAPGLVGR